MRFCYFNIFFLTTLLARVFAFNYVVGGLLAFAISLIRGLSSNKDLLFRFPLYMHIAYFLFVGISNAIASYKDARKPTEMHPRYARILRAFVLWGWLSFVWISASFLSLLDFENDAVFAYFYFLIVIAVKSFLFYYPKVEITSSNLERWRIGLLVCSILYIQAFFAIRFNLDATFKILLFRIIEVSYFVITNCIISMIAGIDREIVNPVVHQEALELIVAV
jgi:hypothetical protein